MKLRQLSFRLREEETSFRMEQDAFNAYKVSTQSQALGSQPSWIVQILEA